MNQLYHFERLRETAGLITPPSRLPRQGCGDRAMRRGYRWAGSFGTPRRRTRIDTAGSPGGAPSSGAACLALLRRLRPPIRRFQRIGRVSVVPFHIPGWSIDRRDVLTRRSRSQVWSLCWWWQVCKTRRQNVQIRCLFSPPKKGISVSHQVGACFSKLRVLNVRRGVVPITRILALSVTAFGSVPLLLFSSFFFQVVPGTPLPTFFNHPRKVFSVCGCWQLLQLGCHHRQVVPVPLIQVPTGLNDPSCPLTTP